MNTYLELCFEIFLKALNQTVSTASGLKHEYFPQTKRIILGMQVPHSNSLGLEGGPLHQIQSLANRIRVLSLTSGESRLTNGLEKKKKYERILI